MDKSAKFKTISAYTSFCNVCLATYFVYTTTVPNFLGTNVLGFLALIIPLVGLFMSIEIAQGDLNNIGISLKYFAAITFIGIIETIGNKSYILSLLAFLFIIAFCLILYARHLAKTSELH